MAILKAIVSNKVLIAALLGWAAAQLLKVILVSVSLKRIDFSRMVGSGGMPSSHSGFTMALAVKTGMICGFQSPSFALAIGFAFVVMYDAAGVRRAAGNQARIINMIINDIGHNKGIKPERLKELIGHTPVEVIAGAVLGIIIGIIV